MQITPKTGLKGLVQNWQSDIHHLECNGEAILIFNDTFSLARMREYSKMLKFNEEMKKMIKKPAKKSDVID